MKLIKSVIEVLEEGKCLLLFLSLNVILIPVYWVASGVYIPSLMSFNQRVSLLQTLIVSLIAFLTSLLLTMLYYQQSSVKRMHGKAGILAGFIGFFASACPVCPPLILSLLGLGGSLYFLADYGLHIGILSLTLLVFSIMMVSENIQRKSCKLTGKVVI